MKYHLINGVFFVQGALRGAILDTNNNRVYSVNSTASSILSGNAQNTVYWEKLENMGLATPTSEIAKVSLPHLEHATQLNFIWLEVVTDNCNERCIHCYANAMPRTYRKNLGMEIHKGSSFSSRRPRMEHRGWLALIERAHYLGCREGQLIGGEPFLYQGPNDESVLDLAEHMVKVGFTMVEIFTNATLLTQKKVDRIKDLGIKIAVSLYSNDQIVHDTITRTPGSFKKTVSAIKMLQRSGVPTRAETVVMRINQDTVPATQLLKEHLGVSGKHPDPLRPGGRGDNSLVYPNFEYLARYGLILKPLFTVSTESLAHYTTGHSCLLGKIAVTEYGDVLPCIFSRDNVVGNILEGVDIGKIIQSPDISAIWRSTKDAVLVCQDCEYRYVCFDCRSLSQGTSQGNAAYLHAPYPRCTYNPYSGEWGKGIWKVNETGKPYYDRSMEQVIQEVIATTTYD